MKIQVLAAVGLTLLFAGCDDSSTVRDSVAVVETDYNNDGIVDQTATLTYSGTTGQLLTQEWDYADPTAEDVLVTYEYDENGFKSREEMANVSDDSVILVVTQINDERGNALEVRYDYDNDGIANRIDYKSYSLDDDMTREAYDFNADGTINRERLYTFASAGQFATRSFDDNGDGVYEYYETVDYEPGNRREIRFLIDRNGDRNFDEEYFASWTDNPDGTMTRFLERDTDMSGSIDRTDTRVMLTDDMREYFQKTLSVVRDFDNDGTPDKLESQTFNSREQVLTSSVDNDADGNPEFLTEYDYDEIGNLTRLRYSNIGGNQYFTITVTYEYWSLGQVDLPVLDSNS
jgi:hypothetical protein